MNEHNPVLLDEVVLGLDLAKNDVVVDLTLGRGGHSEEMLKVIETGHLYGFDQDIEALNETGKRLAKYKNVTLFHENFVNAKDVLLEAGISKVNKILADLGVSSPQFDRGERGFSYRYLGPLDMRMDQRQKLTAHEIVNTYSEKELANIFYKYGENSFGGKIARAIVTSRKDSPIATTEDLVKLIKANLPAKELAKKGHPAKTFFQALRIAVNDELGSLEKMLENVVEMLEVNGRMAVITFHSLEDRIVKQVFRKYTSRDEGKNIPFKLPSVEDEPKYALVNRKVITASSDELTLNPRSESAKLRIIMKVRN